MTTQNRHNGLTLIEIVCVVAVAGILLPMLIYAVGSFFEAGQQTLARIDQLKSAVNVVEIFERDWDNADKLNDAITCDTDTMIIHSRDPILWKISEHNQQYFIYRKSAHEKKSYGPFNKISIIASNITNSSEKNFEQRLILHIDDVKKQLSVK